MALLLLVLLAALAAPASAHAFTVGVGDQKLGMWEDPRFQQLGIRQVRLLVAFDHVLKGDFGRYDRWLTAAHARGADVLIAVNHASRLHTRLPSVATYRRVIRLLRARYPYVRAYGTWNEANHPTQPTWRNPQRAAKYFNALRADCRGCRVVAADLLDSTTMLPWLKRFRRHARKPRLWGLHSYQDANRFRPLRRSSTAALLRAVRGEVWLTEAGGIVRFGTRWRGGERGEQHAARATRRTFALARLSRRITRVYLYHWNAEPRFRTWDSGLVGGKGRARPALKVLRAELNRTRRIAGRAPIPALSAFPATKLTLPEPDLRRPAPPARAPAAWARRRCGCARAPRAAGRSATGRS